LLVVVHTDRDDAIRIVSARRATRRERIRYESKTERQS
ncbi:MAG: BrnT family toxin, partial [Acidobacteria bacterium]|nr:BrnT family toxin [Acidobacteriota bacterium]